MNKKIKKISTSILLMSLMLYSFPVYALTKDETVYTKLNNDGSVNKTIVNNHLKNTNNLSILEDETDLLNILNINGSETFTQNGNSLTWNANGGDIFYQGSLDKPLPITTNIKYYLEGEEKDIKDIIGSKGKITIKMEFTNTLEHTKYIQGKNVTLYTPFVVTTGLILKGDANENVTVTNGKIIENGRDYMVGAIAVPSLYKSLGIEELKELEEIRIEFETTKFELPNIYIVMTPKLIDKEDLKIFDKMNSLYSNVNTLKTSIDEIENGSSALLEGAKQIENGNKQVYETLELITSKVKELNNGANELNKGIQKLVSSLNNLSLPNNFDSRNIPNLINANTVAIEALTNLNTQNQYDQVIYALTEENKLLEKLSAEILPAMLELQKEKNNLQSLSIGSGKIYDATSSLSNGLELLSSSTKELYLGSSSLYEGINSLNTGIHTFNIEGITKINDYLNGNVKNVQNKVEALVDLSEEYKTFSMSSNSDETTTKFIMNIDGIKAPKETKATKKKTEESKNLWQRFIDLFK